MDCVSSNRHVPDISISHLSASFLLLESQACDIAHVLSVYKYKIIYMSKVRWSNSSGNIIFIASTQMFLATSKWKLAIDTRRDDIQGQSTLYSRHLKIMKIIYLIIKYNIYELKRWDP